MSTGPINFGNIQKPNIDELLDKRAQLTEEIKTEKEGNIFTDAADNSNEAAPAAAEPEYKNAALDEAEAAFEEADAAYNEASGQYQRHEAQLAKRKVIILQHKKRLEILQNIMKLIQAGLTKKVNL